MKALGNWKTWESKDGKVKRIYIGKESYLQEGFTGLCDGVNLTTNEIEFLNKKIGKQLFNEVFEQIKTENTRKKSEKKEKISNRKMSLKEIKLLPASERFEAMKANGYC